jgi:hypothetical protein
MRHTRVIVTHYGGPDALRVVEEECPEPKSGEVRVRVLAAGVSLPDLLMREGVHPEKPRLPFTPGWDLIGVVDRLGAGISGIESGHIVAALPISGAYAEFVCLPQRELIPVPSGLDAAEAVSLVLNYVTAYQMLHRSAKVGSGQRVLIHGAAGGVGSALLQLGRLVGLEMYGTCSSRGASGRKKTEWRGLDRRARSRHRARPCPEQPLPRASRCAHRVPGEDSVRIVLGIASDINRPERFRRRKGSSVGLAAQGGPAGRATSGGRVPTRRQTARQRPAGWPASRTPQPPRPRRCRLRPWLPATA